MKTIKTIADLASVLAVYPQHLPLSFAVDRAPVELATDMQIHQVHRPDAPEIPDVLHIDLMDPAAPRLLAECNSLKTANAELYHALGLSAAALRRALATIPHDDEFYGLTEKTELNCRSVMAKHKGKAT